MTSIAGNGALTGRYFFLGDVPEEDRMTRRLESDDVELRHVRSRDS
jgi:hypothetical protein